MKRRLILFAIALAAFPPAVCAEPLEQLGTLTQWFLTFAKDPYARSDLGLSDMTPTVAASALLEGVTFPVGGANAELIERWGKLDPGDVPKALRKFVERGSTDWLRSQGAGPVKVRLVRGPAGAPTLPWREKKKVFVPIPAIGRDLLQAIRQEGRLFRVFMWTLSHPTYAERRATGASAEYWLTGSCEAAPFPAEGGAAGGVRSTGRASRTSRPPARPSKTP